MVTVYWGEHCLQGGMQSYPSWSFANATIFSIKCVDVQYDRVYNNGEFYIDWEPGERLATVFCARCAKGLGYIW